MSSLKLAYELGGWRLLGCEMMLCTDTDGQWMARPDFTGSATDQWLNKHGLKHARSTTRRALLTWISQTHNVNACPHVPEPADSVTLQRIGKDDNNIIYIDKYDLFSIHRGVDMWTGGVVWHVTANFDNFADAWNTEVLTLRHARAHILDFYDQCYEEGTTPEAFAAQVTSECAFELASSSSV